MVDLTSRLQEIRKMIDDGEYFTINQARQYGKTTTLRALSNYLKDDYIVISMDFQRISDSKFKTENLFSVAFARDFLLKIRTGCGKDESFLSPLEQALQKEPEKIELFELFLYLSQVCANAPKPLVLLIDEVDAASNNQVFIDFLGQLRAYYLDDDLPTFQSVVLAGVYDIRNIKRKIRPDEKHEKNSPWNIAADFLVNMSFSASDIAGMLSQYEADYHTGMDLDALSELLYDYTSGYPYLVSRLFKLMDERIAGSSEFPCKADAWTKNGFLEALKILLNEVNPLYQSLKKKLEDYPTLRTVLYDLLFTGRPVPYTGMNDTIEDAVMFGFVKNENGTAVISNRIFETVLYNWFMSEEYFDSKIYSVGVQEKNLFVTDGHLNVRCILEKFVESFNDLYRDQDESFVKEAGRRYFMLFLKPIINGVGNCYVEAQTRNYERTDLVIDYHGEQFIIELKVWRGNAYNERGENQLSDYLDYFHLNKGYMLSFNFNKKKQIGIKDIVIGDKLLVEAVV